MAMGPALPPAAAFGAMLNFGRPGLPLQNHNVEACDWCGDLPVGAV
jgi:hypothetical protein